MDIGELRVVHASIRGNRDGIYPETSDWTLKQQLGKPPAVFCTGHTHRSLVRRLGSVLVVNAGSVGLPFDSDQRLAYAQITLSKSGWQASIIRLPYDTLQAERDFFDTGFYTDAGPLAELVLIELRQARSQLYQWAVRYQRRALDGQISMRQSVDEYLKKINKASCHLAMHAHSITILLRSAFGAG